MKTIAYYASVKASRRAKLGNFLEEIAVRGKEERQPRRKGIDGKTGADRASDVFNGIAERERQLLDRGRAGFADVVSRDRDRIPIRHLVGTESKNLCYQRQARLGRINVGSAGDVLLEDVVLDGTTEFVARDPLFLSGHDVHGEQSRCGRVDRHRGRDLVERNAVE